jgi:ATP-dependent DNA helicase RecG
LAKIKLDPRDLMERAIKVMHDSVHEVRSDGKPNPFVGVVLWKPNGTIDTACRGELRDGDHAEFTVLERKNRANVLDGSVLFATLEPCAPGSRSHPKLSCAERIVLSRIKQVWVGIEDPDPTVDRKGIKHLEDSGVIVNLFDRDLQEQIRAANKDFIAGALERKAAAEEKSKVISLSSLEHPLKTADLRDLASGALEQYRTASKTPEAVNSESFRRKLVQQGLLREDKNKYVPSGFGFLLFGKSPRDHMRQAGLLGTIHYPNGREETRDFDGPSVDVPEQAMQWLRDKLPNVIDRTEARRKERSAALFELVREGIVNALVHRDYDIEGAKCQLVVTPETIVIKSPGGPIHPITLAQLQSFDAPMLSRNPLLHYVFAKMEMAEERGLGLKSMKRGASEAGLPLPKYSWEDPYLVLTLYRNAESAARVLNESVLSELTGEEKRGWSFIARSRGTTQSEYARYMGVTARTAQRHLTHFVELSLLRRRGRGPSTRYEVA